MLLIALQLRDEEAAESMPRTILAGISPSTPANATDLWPSRQEAQPGPFDLPTLPQRQLRSRAQAQTNNKPFSGSPNSPFSTAGASQHSDTFRDLLRSPILKRGPATRKRGL